MTQYRIFPAIGIARVGNAKEKFYVGPEIYRGLPTDPATGAPITPDALRDEQSALSRQAARFQVLPVDEHGAAIALTPDAHASLIVKWSCHLANKKASWYEFVVNEGEFGYASTHKLRNAAVTDRQKLMIDAGPREIAGANAGPVPFTAATAPVGYQGVNFPPGPLNPTGEPIETLGELRTDQYGRLLVLGGHGISGTPGDNLSLPSYANNDDWWDDTSDGVVSALVSTDGGANWSDAGTAHVLVGPPGYAPELPNLVTLWDTIFDAALRHRNIRPEIFEGGFWNKGPHGYKPNFATEIGPLIERAAAYPWVAAIPPKPHHFDMAILGKVPDGHDEFAGLRKFILDVLRPPYQENEIVNSRGATMMPYLAGDNCLEPSTLTSSYLRLTDTQYFFMQQWAEGWFENTDVPPTPGLSITRGVLENCVGGAFSPGIEMGWISRNPAAYQPAEPLRLNNASVPQGPLSAGYNPARLEPGDVTRYMAMPWQADFNECSSQNIGDRVLWWWPSQRPEFVYLPPPPSIAQESQQERAGPQVPWVGTGFDQLRNDYISFAENAGMVENWWKLGFILGHQSGDETRYYEVSRVLPR
jgi:L-Lysine epsilon oxidase N-terminal/L-lysine epsilon oxidase C-terminal domain